MFHRAFVFAAALCAAPVFAQQPAPSTPQPPVGIVVQRLVDEGLVAGIVTLVTDREKVLSLDHAGFARLSTHEPIREDSLFWIASMSKSITGTALMMLVDEGKLSLDDPVEKYLPEFRGQQVAGTPETGGPHPPRHPITVREIMSHTSGLVLANEKGLKQTQSLKDNVALYASYPLRQEPGTKYEYNNCGINTGGRLIEVLSGQPYFDFVQQRLFTPLGMKDTTFWPSEEQASRLAHSARHTADGKGLEEVKLDANVTPAAIARFSEGVPVPAAVIADMGFGISFSYGKHYGEPAGGFFSTARDLGAFCQMLLNGGVHGGKRLLSEAAVHQMTTSQTNGVPVTPSESYGVGWSIKLKDDEGPAIGSFGHRGARRTAMWIDPTHGLATVILVERFDMSGAEQAKLYAPILRAALSAQAAK